jgi:hypothetical protein
MAIGSRVPGASVIAGQYGIISAGAQPVALSQTVRLIDPAATLITLSQSVQQIDRARQMVTLQQRVLGAGVAPSEVRPPAAYVIINGADVTAMTALDTVRVTFNEDQAATAAVFMFVEMGAAVNIPSFHGKSISIETHSDPSDIESEIIPLFTGWIETARHDRQRMGIEFRATDLRDERLGREDGQALKQLTGGLYSNVTQREDASGREYVTELMKTVSGSLGYTRSGDLRYHSWVVGSKPVDLTLTDTDVSYNDLTTEFQTRSSIINSIKIELDYRYSLLRRVGTTIDAYKPRKFTISAYDSAYGRVENVDWSAFRRDYLLNQMDTYSPFEAVSYALYPLEKAETPFGASGIVIDNLWPVKDLWSQGFRAKMERRVAQPVSEKYTMVITAPQSVDAYKETVEGSPQRYAIDTEYERSGWENDFKVTPKLPFSRLSSSVSSVSEPTSQQLASAIAAQKELADNRRQDLSLAFECAYRIGSKQIIAAHRKNYVESKLHRIQPLDIGDVVEHDNRIVQTVGQCTGLEYTIADGLRETKIRTSISYMDTDVVAVDNWAAPTAPAKPAADVQIDTDVEYKTEDKAFEIKIAETPEEYTDNLDVPVDNNYVIALEINPITLINGY